MKRRGWELCSGEVVLSSGIRVFVPIPVEELRPRRTLWQKAIAAFRKVGNATKLQ